MNEPFVVKHYSSDARPTIKGNGFDGLEVGRDRDEAEKFIAFVNVRLAMLDAAIERIRDEFGKTEEYWFDVLEKEATPFPTLPRSTPSA
jgi:hypothetical protein